MIIDLISLKSSSNLIFEEDVVFEEADLKKIDLLKEIKSLKANVKVELVHPYIIVKIALKGDLILYSSRSLKDVDYKVDDVDEITFLLEKIEDVEDEEDIEIIKGNSLDLYPYIYMLFSSSIPMKIVLDDDKENIKGDSWELISEEEYYKRKSAPNSAFASLENFFDDEEE